MKKAYKVEIKFSWWDFAKAAWYLAGDIRKRYLGWTLVLFVILFYDIVPALLIGQIVDFFTKYQSGGSLAVFYTLTAIYGLSYAIAAYIRIKTKETLNKMRSDIVFRTRVLGFEKLLARSMIGHGSETAGVKAQKIQNGAEAFKTLCHIMDNRVFPAITSFVGVIVVFIFLDFVFTFLFVLYMLVFYAILKYFYKRVHRLNYERNAAMEGSSGAYYEGLNNILTIKSSGAEKNFQDHVAGKEKIRNELTHRIIEVNNRQWRVYQIYNGIFIAVFLLAVGMGVVNGSISVGMIVIFYSYMQKLFTSSSDVLNIYSEAITAKTGIAMMMPVFYGAGPEVEGENEFPSGWRKISLKKASFGYRKEEKEGYYKGIREIDLTVERGRKIGLAGKTGSGKSTIAKLMVGLYHLDAGEYLIGGEDFYKIGKENIFNNISLVLQESEMFNLTLKENVTLLRKFDQALFEKAVKISQLDDVIAKLPNGAETLIGEKGYHLSGGERQRVGIARAIYRNAEIMIFDEATSALDNKTERLIQEALEAELAKKTLIFIAHRVSTLKNIDRIYVFKDGRIAEEGSYGDLMRDEGSEFYSLNRKIKK